MTDKKIWPFVSYVIPTLNRPTSIVELVNQLLKQDYPDAFEIVVVDQSANPNELLQRLAARDRRLVYLRREKVGTTGARNQGVKQSRGEIIIFLDDDCRVDDPGFTTTHAKNYTEKSIGGVGGRVIDEDTRLNQEQTGPVCWVSPTGRVYANASGTARTLINAPRGGNMSFRRSVIAQVGGFDERFVGNAMREETDFSLRVVEAGYQIVFDPRAEVTHRSFKTGGSRQRDRRQWYHDFFHNEMLFFLKHFSRWYLPLLFLRKLRPNLACMFYYGKGRPRWLITPLAGFINGWRSYRQAGVAA